MQAEHPVREHPNDCGPAERLPEEGGPEPGREEAVISLCRKAEGSLLTQALRERLALLLGTYMTLSTWSASPPLAPAAPRDGVNESS